MPLLRDWVLFVVVVRGGCKGVGFLIKGEWLMICGLDKGLRWYLKEWEF